MGCNVIFTENDIKNTVYSFYIKPSVYFSSYFYILITYLIDLFLFI